RSLPRSGQPKTVDAPRPAEPPAVSAPSADLTESAAELHVVGVAQLDRDLKRVLEHATSDLLVEGEVVNLHRAGSGHCYFSLKDVTEDALIDAVMYRRAPARARHALEDGQRVVLRGRVTVYAPRGRMQLIATDVVQTRRGELL
ncbi:MAG: exodeoxyribonuclease VII large subunit, partial [Polyangiaceae bacterium]